MRKELYLRAGGWVFMLILVWQLSGCSKAAHDDSISQALKASYFSDPQLKNEPIQIAVTSGEVTLSGEVSSDSVRLQAYKLANETVGVKKVIDSMTVSSSPTTQTAVTRSGELSSSATERRGNPATRPEATREGRKTTERETGSEAIRNQPITPSAVSSSVPAKHYTIPADTDIRIQMIDSVNSKTSQVGSIFQASLDSPLTVEQSVVVPKGANVYVKLVNAKSAG